MSRWQVTTLLEILDMPEDRQRICLAVDGVLKTAVDNKGMDDGDDYLVESLAETAFRMRDEVKSLFVIRKLWWVGLRKVYLHVTKKKYFDGLEFREWFIEEAQPIHWIIAALIAEVRKEQEADFNAVSENN